MDYDVIIIGGGLGGLTAGAKLSKEGKKVLLLEQHDRPGGCATTFKRKDYTMEVGLHEMDGLHDRDMKTRMFQELGIFDRVKFLEVPEFYRFFNERVDIVIPHDPEQAKTVLYAAFPEEKDGIDSYFDHLLNPRRVMVEYRNKPDISIGQFLDNIIHNEDLKLVLLGNLGYFHDDPYSLSFTYYLNAQGSYYGAGRANFIRGGSQMLSNALADIIMENGGEVRLNALATKIEYQDDHPAGVQFEIKQAKELKAFTAKGKEIIVNASVPQLAHKLLSERDGSNLKNAIGKNTIGASLITVYYGFKRSLKEIGNQHYSMFVYHPSVKSQADIRSNNHSSFETRSFTFVDYSQVDADLAPAGKSVGAVCAIDYTVDWEGLSPTDYKARKKQVADIITRRCDAIIPGFADAVEHVEVGTAKSVERYTLNPEGAVYGFAQTPGRSYEYLSALPGNVHIASAWGKFGGGFSGAMISGYMTAMNMLRDKK